MSTVDILSGNIQPGILTTGMSLSVDTKTTQWRASEATLCGPSIGDTPGTGKTPPIGHRRGVPSVTTPLEVGPNILDHTPKVYTFIVN